VVGTAVAGTIEVAAAVMAADPGNPPTVVAAPAPDGTLSRPMASAVPAPASVDQHQPAGGASSGMAP
jgi:hypothetical protein